MFRSDPAVPPLTTNSHEWALIQKVRGLRVDSCEFVVSSDRPVTRISRLNAYRHAKRCQNEYEEKHRQSNARAARTSDNFSLRCRFFGPRCARLRATYQQQSRSQ